MKVVWRIDVGWGGQFTMYPFTIPKGAKIDVKRAPGQDPHVIARHNWEIVTVTRGKARWAAWILFWLQARPPKETDDGEKEAD